MINSGDIINYKDDIWISQEYLLEHTSFSDDYLRVAKHRARQNANRSWQHQAIMNRCYFQYSSLPRSASNQMNPPNELVKFAAELQDDVTNIIGTAQYSSFKMFMPDMSRELAKSAAVIHEASMYCKSNGIKYTRSRFFKGLAKEIELSGLKYLPKTWRNLRDKIRDYASGTPIDELVKAKNEGNSNRAIFANNELIKNWIIELADSEKNYSYAFMWRKLRTISQQQGIEQIPSKRWVSDFLTKPETQFLIHKRYGDRSRFNHKYRAYTPGKSALFAGDAWDIDGTRVNIIDHRGTWTDKNGKKRKGQKFLYIVAVRDVMSGLPVGWEYCYEESADAIINALAMAVKNTGYLPYEIRYDRFPGHNTSDWHFVEDELRRSGVTMTQTTEPEGKGRTERWFGTLQSVFMMDSDLYYGEGVKSTRRYAHRSKEYVSKMRQQAIKEGFDFDQAVHETDKILDNYINTPYSWYSEKYKSIDSSPLELHEDSDKPNVVECEQAHWSYLFGLKKQISVRNNMILTQIHGATYYYAIDDVDIIEQYTGQKLWNCFDYENLDEVHLFNGDTYLGTFDRIDPMQQYGPDKDMRAAGITKSINEKVVSHREKRLQELKNSKLPNEDEGENISPELGVLQGGRIKKADHEAAETAYLRKEWDDDDEDLDISARNQY
jgi:hypothetical protein